MQIFKTPNFDFLRWRWHALALSWVIILVGAFVVYVLPESLRFLNDYYYLVFGFVIMLLMLVLPRGLVSLIPGLRAGNTAISAGRAARP